MYIPKSFENKNIDQLHQFMEKFNFATLVSNSDKPQISHVPVMLDRTQGEFGTLIWHVAKINSHATVLDGNKNSLFIFHGPHAYISPAWYKTVPNVPTWNYAVVHAFGTPERVNKTQLSQDLTQLVNYHESLLNQKENYIIPDSYKEKLLEHIEGFRMEIKKIEGKFKLGQNRSVDDRNGMINGLRNQNNDEAQVLADFIQSF